MFQLKTTIYRAYNPIATSKPKIWARNRYVGDYGIAFEKAGIIQKNTT